MSVPSGGVDGEIAEKVDLLQRRALYDEDDRAFGGVGGRLPKQLYYHSQKKPSKFPFVLVSVNVAAPIATTVIQSG
jgi:hypothetical protein